VGEIDEGLLGVACGMVEIRVQLLETLAKRQPVFGIVAIESCPEVSSCVGDIPKGTFHLLSICKTVRCSNYLVLMEEIGYRIAWSA
jgi:hypothetical protein